MIHRSHREWLDQASMAAQIQRLEERVKVLEARVRDAKPCGDWSAPVAVLARRLGDLERQARDASGFWD